MESRWVTVLVLADSGMPESMESLYPQSFFNFSFFLILLCFLLSQVSFECCFTLPSMSLQSPDLGRAASGRKAKTTSSLAIILNPANTGISYFYFSWCFCRLKQLCQYSRGRGIFKKSCWVVCYVSSICCQLYSECWVLKRCFVIISGCRFRRAGLCLIT